MRKNPHAVALGRRGGNANTPAQQQARAKNRNRDGRPRLYRLNRGHLEKRDSDGRWLTLEPPLDRAAREALRRLKHR